MNPLNWKNYNKKEYTVKKLKHLKDSGIGLNKIHKELKLDRLCFELFQELSTFNEHKDEKSIENIVEIIRKMIENEA